jgi:hypothetical protein
MTLQLVLSGDFCQLPPVPDRHGSVVCFAFDARSWRECFEFSGTATVHRLTKVFRQSDESLYPHLAILWCMSDTTNSLHRDAKLVETWTT